MTPPFLPSLVVPRTLASPPATCSYQLTLNPIPQLPCSKRTSPMAFPVSARATSSFYRTAYGHWTPLDIVVGLIPHAIHQEILLPIYSEYIHSLALHCQPVHATFSSGLGSSNSRLRGPTDPTLVSLQFVLSLGPEKSLDKLSPITSHPMLKTCAKGCPSHPEQKPESLKGSKARRSGPAARGLRL